MRPHNYQLLQFINNNSKCSYTGHNMKTSVKLPAYRGVCTYFMQLLRIVNFTSLVCVGSHLKQVADATWNNLPPSEMKPKASCSCFGRKHLNLERVSHWLFHDSKWYLSELWSRSTKQLHETCAESTRIHKFSYSNVHVYCSTMSAVDVAIGTLGYGELKQGRLAINSSRYGIRAWEEGWRFIYLTQQSSLYYFIAQIRGHWRSYWESISTAATPGYSPDGLVSILEAVQNQKGLCQSTKSNHGNPRAGDATSDLQSIIQAPRMSCQSLTALEVRSRGRPLSIENGIASSPHINFLVPRPLKFTCTSLRLDFQNAFFQ